MKPVLVVDDHFLIRLSLAQALEAAGLEVHVAEFCSGQDILDQASSLPPGLAVMDLELGMDPAEQHIRELEIISQLIRQHWQVFVLSGVLDIDRVTAAIAAGAVGWAAKSAAVEDIVAAVSDVAAGRPGMPSDQRQRMLDQYRRREAANRDRERRLARLSTREREVLELMAHGLRAVTIAERLVVSVTTVRSQIQSILRKLDAESQLAAVAMLHEHRQLGRTN